MRRSRWRTAEVRASASAAHVASRAHPSAGVPASAACMLREGKLGRERQSGDAEK